MKKIQLLFLFLLMLLVPGFSQVTDEIFLGGNYVLVPHNSQYGAGYSIGINHGHSKRWWLSSELSYSQAMSEKGSTIDVGAFTILPKLSHTVTYQLSVTPSVSLPLGKHYYFRVGAGFSAIYQSGLTTNYRYLHYLGSPGGLNNEEITGVGFREGYHLGGNFQAALYYQLSEKVSIFTSASYKTYWGAESFFTAGLGINYSF
jgi:hypothetical protein